MNRGGLDLPTLLGPLATSEFFRTYWEQRPVHIRSRLAEFAELYTRLFERSLDWSFAEKTFASYARAGQNQVRPTYRAVD